MSILITKYLKCKYKYLNYVCASYILTPCAGLTQAGMIKVSIKILKTIDTISIIIFGYLILDLK